MGKVNDAVLKLHELRAEEDRIRRRLEKIPSELGKEEIPARETLEDAISNAPRNYSDAQAAKAIAARRAPKGESVNARIARSNRDIERSRAGGLREPDPDLLANLQDLEDQRDRLIAEQVELTKRLEEIAKERISIIRASVKPAWEQYCKARDNEISKGLELAKDIRERVRIYKRNLIGRREQTERTLGGLRGAIAEAHVSLDVAFEDVKREVREPMPPQRKPGRPNAPDWIRWKTLQAVLAACEAAEGSSLLWKRR